MEVEFGLGIAHLNAPVQQSVVEITEVGGAGLGGQRLCREQQECK